MQSNVKYYRPMKDCRGCGELFQSKDNKFFCNTKCKNTYNNRERRETSAVVRATNRMLRDNYSILEKLWNSPSLEFDVPFLLLEHEGFDISYFTGVSENEETDGIIMWVYNLGIEFSEAEESIVLRIRDAAGNIL